ncbi:hypothetical protein DPEC_G00210330 [Dallia pectoralis]|uniref:Uncharacterized protein n=1 Tax=Dallia pectoralis TaxID=75939 RepID=A0ACC2G5N4_DALPE|nr:hypothetical protein DPEC_G00210330 [Dallia pectoralis]
MSERADDDVRGEQRRTARQLKQQQQQIRRGEGSTAMATVAERRSLPSPEITPGLPWSDWVDAAKLHGNDGAESEESLKEFGKNREAMRLCGDDMAIFGQCPAQDNFYLVVCSQCGQVVKPQAFQAHYERRHSSASKPTSTTPSALSLSALSRNRSSGTGTGTGLGAGCGGGGGGGGGVVGRSSSSGTSASSNSRIFKPAKEKLPGIQRRPPFPPLNNRMINDKILTPAVKVEKIHVKVVQAPIAPLSASSSSSSTVSSSSPLKPGLNCPSIPKAPLLAPGQIPNGKNHVSLSSLEKKQENSSKRHLYKRLSEREFNPDIHCGVLDMTARKPCTRSLTCKTHSLSQRRAVPGRRKRFDALDPHPSPSRLAPHHDSPHPVAHSNGAAAADPTKPLPLGQPNPPHFGLSRLNSSISHGGGGTPGDPPSSNELPHSTPAPDGVSRLSSDEGENEEREEGTDRLDLHYSGCHPRPTANCTFGSRLFGKSCYSFDRRWDRLRCALSAMMDKHVNTRLWKKIPSALENSSSSAPAHRTSTTSLSSSHASGPASGFLSPSTAPPPPPYSQSYDSRPVLSYGTTLNARASSEGAADHPAYSAVQARQVSSSPQMPSAHSSVPSLSSARPLKSRPGGKSFRPRESSSTAPVTPSASGGSLSSGKKRKNSSLLTLTQATAYFSESNTTTSSSSFKKNCSVNSVGSGSTYHHASSLVPSSSSSSHSGVHSLGLNCGPNARTNSLSLKAEGPAVVSGPGVRGPPSGSPAESIKRMSVVMNSSDSTLSLGPFIHQASEHHGSFSHAHGHPDGRLEGKKRKSSPASCSINSGGGGLGGGGAVLGRPKVAKSPAINNIHGKHGRTVPGAPGLPSNSLIHQPKARP